MEFFKLVLDSGFAGFWLCFGILLALAFVIDGLVRIVEIFR